MKIGIYLLPWTGGMAGETPRWHDVLAMARATEDAGFDSLWVSDHLLHRFPGEEPQGPWEGWSLLSALAAVTSRVTLGTNVLCIGFRNPALLAKMADTVDEIAAGRLVLGLGAGWHEPEYRALGIPFDHRASRFEEAVRIISGLLRDGQVDFQGRYYQACECELRPRAGRAGGPPIMVGTRGERMLRMTARHADWWNGSWPNDIGRARPLLAAVDAACADVGRDASTLTRTAGVMVDLTGDWPHRGHDWVTRLRAQAMPLTGTSEQLALALRGYADAGFDHLQVWLDPLTPQGIERFAEVLPLVRDA